jgi:hypothetical protein
MADHRYIHCNCRCRSLSRCIISGLEYFNILRIMEANREGGSVYSSTERNEILAYLLLDLIDETNDNILTEGETILVDLYAVAAEYDSSSGNVNLPTMLVQRFSLIELCCILKNLSNCRCCAKHQHNKLNFHRMRLPATYEEVVDILHP